MTKRAAILEAARQMFTRHDFVSASMDQIAACAGVSKLTVYNHFGDKDTLFGEVVRERCEQSFPIAMFHPAPETPLREVLLTIAVTYFATISSEEALNWHRVMCSLRLRDSSLIRRFWEAGPERIQASLVELLVRRRDAGEHKNCEVTILSCGRRFARRVFSSDCSRTNRVPMRFDDALVRFRNVRIFDTRAIKERR